MVNACTLQIWEQENKKCIFQVMYLASRDCPKIQMLCWVQNHELNHCTNLPLSRVGGQKKKKKIFLDWTQSGFEIQQPQLTKSLLVPIARAVALCSLHLWLSLCASVSLRRAWTWESDAPDWNTRCFSYQLLVLGQFASCPWVPFSASETGRESPVRVKSEYMRNAFKKRFFLSSSSSRSILFFPNPPEKVCCHCLLKLKALLLPR